MNEYYFHLDHLTVGYDKKPLIKDICIGIEKGEIVTLIGPNGSGKSTILKSITRQLKLVGGNVEFDGKNLHELSFRELSTKMAVVLTERMKPELMTCHDIVATGRYPYTGRLGMLTREDEEKVEKAMRAVHAEELGGRDFNAISDGQRLIDFQQQRMVNRGHRQPRTLVASVDLGQGGLFVGRVQTVDDPRLMLDLPDHAPVSRGRSPGTK